MNFALHMLTGKRKGEEIFLPEDQDILIGLKGEGELVIEDELTSNKLVMISTVFQRVTIRDLNSGKGTFVNGKSVKESHLKEGDRVRIGPVTCMLVVLNRFSAGFQASQARTEVLYHAAIRPKNPLEALSAIAGTLKEMSVIEVIQFLTNSKKDGVLTLVSSQGTGKIHLREGQVCYAAIGENLVVSPERILFRLMAWNDGTFSFGPPEDRKFPKEIKSSPESLLMEGSRVVDELARLKSELPDREARLAVAAPPVGGNLRDLSPKELDVLQLVMQHTTLQAVMDHHPVDDEEAGNLLADLIGRKFIVVQPAIP